jgi:hypothetical protein
MTAANEQVQAPTFDELMETHKILAKEILEGDEGYVVLETIFSQLLQQCYMTSFFTLPVLSNMDEISSKLDNPDEFKLKLSQFIGGIRQFQKDLLDIYSLHKGKKGGAAPKDYPVMYSISERYSKMMEKYDKEINPLHIELFKEVQENAPELMEIKTFEENKK